MPIPLFNEPAPIVARDLIGSLFLADGVGGRIVETEAYDAADPASHSFRGPTPRNAPMFGPPGRAYVYRIYGLHWCFNIVCDSSSPGSAVLIRALSPTAGLGLMQARRGAHPVARLCAGPGRLCQALWIDDRLNGLPLDAAPFTLIEATEAREVSQGPRIGLSVETGTPWRLIETGSRFVSRAMPASIASPQAASSEKARRRDPEAPG